jgi:hypothetical protein
MTTQEKTMPSKTEMTSDSRTVAELEAAVVAGDETVTAEQLEAARARERHAQLLSEGAAHRAFRAAEAARQAEIEKLRADMSGLADDREHLLTLVRKATDALAEMFVAARARGAQLDDLAGRARVLGITAMSLDDQIRDASDIGWRRDHQQVGPARLRIGDVALGAVDPVRLTARIVQDVFDRAGQRTDRFSLANAGAPVVEQISATVRTVSPPEVVKMRVLKRWGAHQPGTVVEVDPEAAHWARQRGYAQPA